ncbi:MULTISPECIES: BglG family transcription antiterminator [unclassified Gilliamella]|uniref:BglG family transcription antiterminator n=1 Tax=unclassified Gilliamella TaxID=2685620 RepID=UPI0013272698|nr:MULTISPECIES: PTS sugar transporter subunit IIA [unclassified Gilliamella]MWN30922.1 PRD domain-containing protein [Gilliamella sp. Pra-s60]MWP28513.1 PRD domain-containing protein [Gilliamella sp. Pra-s54]
MERQIELLKLLFKESEFKPATYFSAKLSISTKTIYSDIEKLNDRLLAAPNSDIYIEKSPRKGLLLTGNKDCVDLLIDYLEQNNSHGYFNKNSRRLPPEYRRLDIVKRCLLNQESVSLEQLSDDYIVSKTSLHKDIEFINRSLESENVLLVVTHKAIVIEGKESQIQRAIKHFLLLYINKQDNYYLNQLMNSLMGDDSFEQISQLLFKHHESIVQRSSEYYLSSLLISIAIQLKRLTLGYPIDEEDDFLFNHIRYMQSYLIASDLAKQLGVVFNIEFSTNDIKYLSKLFFAHRIIDESVKVDDSFYEQMIRKIIKKIGEIEGVDLSKDSKLFHSLLSHFPPMVTRLQKQIRIINPILKEIKLEYSKLFSVLWYALSDLEHKFNIRLNDHEISFLLIHFQIALDKAADANNIVIICQYGCSSSNLILNKVRKILPSKDNIEVYSVSKLTSTNLSNVDLIITTLDINNLNKPVVKISSLLNTNDYQNIIQAYANYVLNKQSDFSEKNNCYPSTAKFVDPDLIELSADIDNKNECLNQLIKQLEDKGYVTHHYRDSVLHREEIGDTSIENGIALPHGSPMFVTKSSISIMTLRKPIKWGLIDVSVIIMVSLSEKNINSINEVFTEIYEIVSNKHAISALKNITSFKQLKLFLDNQRGIKHVL